MKADPISFRSTRGGQDATSTSFADALFAGLAPDGGLYVPQSIPRIDRVEAETFSQVAAEVLMPWLTYDIDAQRIRDICADAFNFPVPLVALEGPGYDDVFVLELFHGPTLSFKDFAARCMGRLIPALQSDTSARRTVFVATSGDTGSAVADGLSHVDGVSVVILYPKGRVSQTQERQLIVRRPGVRTFAVDGDFDACQALVKQVFRDDRFKSMRPTSANSINVGRLIPQTTYYWWGALAIDRPTICVPSGNLGNLTAGVMAALSGLGVRRFVAAHNANSFFPEFLSSSDRSPRETVSTLSNAMDVGVPSNFERLDFLLDYDDLRERIWGTSVDDRAMLERMKQLFETTGYVADPHTAVGIEGLVRFRQTGAPGPIVVLATAHPAKFSDIVSENLGVAVAEPSQLAVLQDRASSVTLIANAIDDLFEALSADPVH